MKGIMYAEKIKYVYAVAECCRLAFQHRWKGAS